MEMELITNNGLFQTITGVSRKAVRLGHAYILLSAGRDIEWSIGGVNGLLSFLWEMARQLVMFFFFWIMTRLTLEWTYYFDEMCKKPIKDWGAWYSIMVLLILCVRERVTQPRVMNSFFFFSLPFSGGSLFYGHKVSLNVRGWVGYHVNWVRKIRWVVFVD